MKAIPMNTHEQLLHDRSRHECALTSGPAVEVSHGEAGVSAHTLLGGERYQLSEVRHRSGHG